MSAVPEVGPPAVTRVSALAREAVPGDLLAWADRCSSHEGFPLLGTGRSAEPYVALQWNGERAARAGLMIADLVVLTGLVTAWQLDRTVGDLHAAVDGALAVRASTVTPLLNTGAPVSADVVTTAVCAGLLSGVPEDEVPTLADLAGTLLQVSPLAVEAGTAGLAGRTVGGPAVAATAAGHTAAAGWLAVQVHLAGLSAYPGALADTVATAGYPTVELDPAAPVRALVAGLR